MSDITITRTTTELLQKLHDSSDNQVWGDFHARYQPVLAGIAKRMGLQPDEIEDVAQETLLQFVRAYRAGQYAREKGRLRVWIHGILRHRALDALRSRARAPAHGESILLTLEDEEQAREFERAWEDECRRKILDDALQRLVETGVQPETVEAFRRYALEDRPAAEVAEQLGLPVNSVYLAKHRCAKRLQTIVSEMTAAFEN